MGVIDGGSTFRVTLENLFGRLMEPDSKTYPGIASLYQVVGYLGIVQFSPFENNLNRQPHQPSLCQFEVAGTIQQRGHLLAFQYQAKTSWPEPIREESRQIGREEQLNAAVDQSRAEYLLIQHHLTRGTEVELCGIIRNTDPRLLHAQGLKVNFPDSSSFKHGYVDRFIL